jgi:uncharacterized membrane protein
MTVAMAILGLIAISALILFIAYCFMVGAEQEGKKDPEAGCGMGCIAFFLVILVAHIWIVVLTAGQ